MDQPNINDLVNKFPALRQALGVSRPVDVGGCGAPTDCDATSCSGAGGVVQTPGCEGANIYTTSYTFGFQLGVDCDGNIYTRDCHRDSTGAVDGVSFLLQGTSMNIDFDQGGFLCIYGINANLLDGPPVVINALESGTDLQRHENASITVYETTGCWCPFEACIIGGQTPLKLELDLAPTPADTVLGAGGAAAPYDGITSTTNLPQGYYSSIEINFLATAARVLGGSALIANNFYNMRTGSCS